MMDRIRDGDIRLIDTINNQNDLLLELGEIKKGNPKHKSKANKEVIKNV